MSSSVVSPAQWSGALPATVPVDSGSSSRRPKKTMPPLKKEANPKSTSPAPTTSTRSTRSRKTVTYSESDSPELANGALPPVPKPARKVAKAVTTPKPKPPSTGGKRKSTKMARTASTMSYDSQRTDSQATTVSPSVPIQELPEVGEVIVAELPGTTTAATTIPAPKPEVVKTPEPVKADLPLPPSTSTLKISLTNTGGIKRGALSQDPAEDNEGSTTYDETPRISPNPDNGVTVESTPQAEEVKNDGPKRAPRKKRKWLKRGEVDPDDPVAVARQQERFGLLDKATEVIAQEMEAVRNGTHPDLSVLQAQLDIRRDRQLQQATARFEFRKAELMTSKLQAQNQAKSDHWEDSERIIEDLRTTQRRIKHRLLSEKITLIRNPRGDAYPLTAFGRGSGGYPIHTSNLASNLRQKLIDFGQNGQLRQRKDITMRLEAISTRDALADLEEMNRHRKSSPPVDRRRGPSTRLEFSRSAVAGPSGTSAVTRIPVPGPKTGAYEVTDLPPYRAGAVPMRQTPTHSPTPTTSRRTSPVPQAQPVASSSSSATVLNRYPNVRPPGQATHTHQPAVTSTLVNGSGPARSASGLSNGNTVQTPQLASGMYAQSRRL